MISQAIDDKMQTLVLTLGMMGANWLFSGRVLPYFSIWASHSNLLLMIVNDSNDGGIPNVVLLSWAVGQFELSN